MIDNSFKCIGTMIGSMPQIDANPACEMVLKYLPEIPAIPEFPQKGYKATFCGPFLENLPSLIDDDAREISYFNISEDTSADLEKFYENFLSENLEYFAISEKRSPGLYQLLDILEKTTKIKPVYIKSQMPGPITTGLTLKDQHGQSIIYNEEYMQVIIKSIIMKSRWQIEKIKKVNPNIIFFFDEPSLISYGSSYFNFDKNYIINTLNEVLDSVDVITGSHCCGNTDWGVLMETNVDIISFDAFALPAVLGLYTDQLNKFLSRNGGIAWGIIPNSEKIFDFSPEDLVAKLEKDIILLEGKGFSKEKILNASLITPSCGLGNEKLEVAEKVLDTTQKVSLILKNKYSNILQDS